MAALDAAEEAEALHLGDVSIVWLFKPAIAIKTSDDAGRGGGYMPHEDALAVVIQNYLGRYTLVRAL